METISVPLIWGTAQKPRRLEVCGQRMLVGMADTGVFRILNVGRQLADAKSASKAGDDDDAFAFATLKIDGPLELAHRNGRGGGDPYNRHGRKVR